MGRDLFLLGLAGVLRSFNCVASILPLYLRANGFSVMRVGTYAFLATLSSAVRLVVAGFLGDFYSRKKTMLGITAPTIPAYTSFLVTTDGLALLLTSLLGLSLS